MNTQTRKPMKKIARLIASHLRSSETGRRHFEKSGRTLDRIVSLNCPLNEPIELADGRKVVLHDQFQAKNTAFSAKMFQRYRVDDWKEPKPPKIEEAVA